MAQYTAAVYVSAALDKRLCMAACGPHMSMSSSFAFLHLHTRRDQFSMSRTDVVAKAAVRQVELRTHTTTFL